MRDECGALSERPESAHGEQGLVLPTTPSAGCVHVKREYPCARCLWHENGSCSNGTLPRVSPRTTRVSVVVITHDEAPNIDAALASVAWADEIVVIDSGSGDDTVERAKRYTDRVFHHDWLGYGPQKDHATSVATYDWVFSLDADERVSHELASEIKTLLATEPLYRGYRMPRATRYQGHWIRTTDWYPDYQLRLYDRRVATWGRQLVHESVRVQGAVGRLQHEIHHYPYQDFSAHLATIDRYTSLAARQLRDNGRRARLLDLAVHPISAFLRNYVLRRGCLQGSIGFIVSVMNAYYVFLKYAKLRAVSK